MSNTSYPDDAASFSQAESSKEELDLCMSDSDCQTCLNLRLPDPNPMRTTYAELQCTATEGCWLCKLLQRVSETACIVVHTVIQNTDSVSVFPGILGAEQNAARLRVTRSTGDGVCCIVTFYAASGDSCPWPFMTSNFVPDENASIQECAQSINRMLDECNKHHTSTCNVVDSRQQLLEKLEPPRFIPKRLLHIRSDNMSFQVRLRETARDDASLKETGFRYTTLSHCWGSTPIINTTTARVSSFERDGINWISLPKTFQEAILLTHELSIDYIWIDSLCILQDSVDDWAEQSSQMAKIFSNAYLTIAASASENGQQGLLNRRRTTQKLDVVHNGKAFAVYVRDGIEHEFEEDLTDLPFAKTTRLPLRKRAWCLQEELLSTRIVHFTEDESVFVCQEGTICECRPIWWSRYTLRNDIWSPSKIWENILEHYTGRQISFCKDRLPAISSLTNSFEEHSDRYHAGLWESHMPRSLLWWSQCGKRPEQEQNSQSRSPSWSWASIEGNVKYTEIHDIWEDVADVLVVCTYPSTSDPRGMVSGGQITLRAPLFPLAGTWKKSEGPWQTFVEWHSGDSSFGSCFACSPGWAPGWAPKLDWSGEDDCYCVLDDPANPLLLLPDHAIDNPIFLLIICTLEDDGLAEEFPRLPHPEGYRFLGLLLQPLENLNQTQMNAMEDSGSKLSFVRIGFGGMCLHEEVGREALNRFGNTTVTIF